MRAILKKIYHTPVVKKTIIDVVSVFNPPPYRRELMEFEFDLWSGISAIQCVNKRQLGESNTFPGLYRENTPTEYFKGNFDGSRAGLYMNMTSLQSVMSQWRAALTLIGAIRRCYVERFNVGDKNLDPAELFVLSKMCTALPAFLARRFVNPMRDGEIPASVAAEFKITAGVFMTLRKMMENGIRWSEAGTHISAEALYEYADKHNVFISSGGYACSGSKRKIIELIDFMIKGDVDGGRLPGKLLRLTELVADTDVFLNYSVRALTLEILIGLCRAIAAQAFVQIDLNILQDDEQEKFSGDYARILNNVRRIFPAGVNLDCQIEVSYALLDKLGAGNLGSELKGRIAESKHGLSAELAKQTPELPKKFRYSLAGTVGEYMGILGFLGYRGKDLQDKIFAVLGRKQTARLSMHDVERRLGIVTRRRLEKISGFDMGSWYNKPNKILDIH